LLNLEINMSMTDELERLSALRAAGSLTEEEFAQAKAKLLRADFVETASAAAKDAASSVSRNVSQGATNVLARLRRSRTDRWLSGVSGGLADLTDIPSWAWRVFFILMAFLHGLGLLIYVLMWIFVPMQPAASAPALAAPSTVPPDQPPSA
jgi:phage shock protein C